MTNLGRIINIFTPDVDGFGENAGFCVSALESIDSFIGVVLAEGSFGNDVEIVLDDPDGSFMRMFYAYEWEDIREEVFSDIKEAPFNADLDPCWEDSFREELYY